MKYIKRASAFCGERWTSVVRHLYRVFALMPVASAICFTLLYDNVIANLSNASVSVNVVINNHLPRYKEGDKIRSEFRFFLSFSNSLLYIKSVLLFIQI